MTFLGESRDIRHNWEPYHGVTTEAIDEFEPGKKLFKILKSDLSSTHGGDHSWTLPLENAETPWEEEVEAVRCCNRGYHLTSNVHKWMLIGARVFEAEGTGEWDKQRGYGDGEKLAFAKARLVREVSDLESLLGPIWMYGQRLVERVAEGLKYSTHATMDHYDSRNHVLFIPDWKTALVVARGSYPNFRWISSASSGWATNALNFATSADRETADKFKNHVGHMVLDNISDRIHSSTVALPYGNLELMTDDPVNTSGRYLEGYPRDSGAVIEAWFLTKLAHKMWELGRINNTYDGPGTEHPDFDRYDGYANAIFAGKIIIGFVGSGKGQMAIATNLPVKE